MKNLRTRILQVSLAALLWVRRIVTSKLWVRLFLSDLDHTMYGCMDYIIPAIREWLPIASRATGLSEREIARRLGTVFRQAGTHDFVWAIAIALLHDWKGSVADFVAQIEEPYWRLQDEWRQRTLRAYPGVLAALDKIRERGVPIYAVTDSPGSIALAKLLTTGVGERLTGMVALKMEEPTPCSVYRGMRIPDREGLKFGTQRLESLMALAAQLPNLQIELLPVDLEKPSPEGMLTAIRMAGGINLRNVFHLGDSIKDVNGARNANLGGVFYVSDHLPSCLVGEYLHIMNELMEPDDQYLVHDPRAKTVYPNRRHSRTRNLGHGSFAVGVSRILGL